LFDLAKYLSAYKIKALSYHAGLSDSKRQLAQNQWANDDCDVRKSFIGNRTELSFFY
jgi:superfamily II DNA helicase RecQ